MWPSTLLISHGCAKEQFLLQETKVSASQISNFYKNCLVVFKFTNLLTLHVISRRLLTTQQRSEHIEATWSTFAFIRAKNWGTNHSSQESSSTFTLQ
ncbi:hypothetical protein AVEN_168553-1 [Araneus ventricosus]|uniref:Uncharacterized protein n=1 Tax=Araneus ventricosus TaxID=182803 RepID=A0A4Y2FR89_ARAVE|nr:hypothetical protein AVEN_168553-1 [Araneus ventricosus]